MASNGHLLKSELAPIPGGSLRVDAAASWNAPGGPADAGLRPGGPDSSYRTYDRQVFWRDYWCSHGLCENAAIPGTSNHGWGLAVDIPNTWEQEWMREHGAKYGWFKNEAFSEPWHWTYVTGHFHPPTFKELAQGDRGPRVIHYTKRLAFVRDHHMKGPYLRHWYWTFKAPVRVAVREFQHDHDLKITGRIDQKTGAQIDATFHKQYVKRGK